ncbi:MAG: ArsR/SmtB family transcription factor [Ornithinimicrobium sp.]|uniref:ArsR/SmtB family transcription factor n=1 Tax=Ornithinimicrobium sp. TaxID=1977084 RepID=UPI003D9BA399
MSVAPNSTFAALADPTRWSILVRLGQEPASATTLAAELPVSRQAVAKHLAVLRETGLVVPAAGRGREVRFEALGARLSEAGRDLERIAAQWDRRLAGIKELAERPGLG